MDSSSDLTDLSSELSSPPCSSPPSPLEYPSPISSQDVSNECSSEEMSRKRPVDDRERSPVRKRRKVEPKVRTTQYLDLRPPPLGGPVDQREQLAILTQLLRKRRKIVVIAGAGISTSAGIPDFRSKDGLFTTLKNDHSLRTSGKQLFDASVYQTDEGTTRFHAMVRSLSEKSTAAKPTAFHHLLASLAHKGQLMRLYTQNVDGIDTSLPPLQTVLPLSSKGPWPRTIQLHGGLEKMVCSKCCVVSDFEPALFEGPEAPPCSNCREIDRVRISHAGKRSHGVGCLRPRIVLYNEQNPDDEAIGAVVKADLRARPDAVVVVGTSMRIPGVKRIVREMCGVVRGRRDGIAVWINQGPPPPGKEFEDCWDLVVKGDCDRVAEHAAMKRWDDTSIDYEETTESDVERAKSRDGEVCVLVESPAKRIERTALPTPAPSPRPKEKAPIKLVLSKGKLKSQGPATVQAMAKKRTKPVSKPKTGPDASIEACIKKSFKTTKASDNTTASQPVLAKVQVSSKPTNEPRSPSSCSNRSPTLPSPRYAHAILNPHPEEQVTPPPSRNGETSATPLLSPNTLFRDPRTLPPLGSPNNSFKFGPTPERLSSSPTQRLSSPREQYATPPEYFECFRRVSRGSTQSSMAPSSETSPSLTPGQEHSSPAQSIPWSPSAWGALVHINKIEHPSLCSIIGASRPSSTQSRRSSFSSSFRPCSTPKRQLTYNPVTPAFSVITPVRPKQGLGQHGLESISPVSNVLSHATPSPKTTMALQTRWLDQSRPSTPSHQVASDPEELISPAWSTHTAYKSYLETQRTLTTSRSQSPPRSPSLSLQPFGRSFRLPPSPRSQPFREELARWKYPPDWSPISPFGSDNENGSQARNEQERVEQEVAKQLIDMAGMRGVTNDDGDRKKSTGAVPSHGYGTRGRVQSLGVED